MNFEHNMISDNKSLSETLRELFGDFEDESDAEETTTFAVESVPVQSNNILAADLRASVCSKRKRQEPGDPRVKKIRLLDSGVDTDLESDDENPMTVVVKTTPIPSNNVVAADLRRSPCNKRKHQEPDNTSEKQMRLTGAVDVKSINGSGDVEHTQTVVPDPRILDG
jgi:hypothetical protein